MALKKEKDKFPDITTISKFCLIHTKNETTLYCSQHEELVCDICSKKNHHYCKPLLSLKRAADMVKKSTTLPILKRKAENLAMLVRTNMISERDIQQRQKDAKTQVVNTIAEIKKQIILHLDNIEKALLIEIETYSNDTEQQTEAGLQVSSNLLDHWTKNLTSFKGRATDIDFFRAAKYLDKLVYEQEQNKTRLKKTDAPIITFHPSDLSTNYKSIITSLGRIAMEMLPRKPMPALETKPGLFHTNKDEQRLSLIETVELKNESIDMHSFRGCFIPYGKLLLTSTTDNVVFCCGLDGSSQNTLVLEHTPSRVILYDNDRALVTTSHDYIQIINLSNLSIGEEINVGKQCRAICSRDELILVGSEARVITLVEIDGTVEKTIKTKCDPYDICFHQSRSLFYTTSLGDAVYKISQEGEEFEIYRNPDLQVPRDIIADEDGFIYVSGRVSNNIHRISPNGKHHTIALNKFDNIMSPLGLDFNIVTKQLMVINNDGLTVNIYRVTSKI